MMEDSKVKHTMVSPQSVVLTYYEGDINTVVDEHFFRALNKNSMPKDLSTKPRHRPLPIPSETPAPSSSWSSSWSGVTFPPNHGSMSRLGQGQCFSGDLAIRPPSVIVSCPEPSPAVWSFPKQYTPPSRPDQRPTAPTLHNMDSGIQMMENRPNFYWH